MLAHRLLAPGLERRYRLCCECALTARGLSTGINVVVSAPQCLALAPGTERSHNMFMEYTKDLPTSQQWLDANQPYFKHMSSILHLLDPQMYVRYTSVNKFLPEGLKPACRI